MDIYKGAERLMGMDDATWARHAHPISGYSRIFSAPVVFLALWSGFWIGWWALVPIGAVLVWMWLNPRLVAPPQTADAWATRAVLGERVFLNRKSVPVPHEFVFIGHLTTVIAAVFAGFTAFGFWIGEFWLAFVSWHAAVLSKVWFIDRMALLWDRMKDATPRYQAWARADWGWREGS